MIIESWKKRRSKIALDAFLFVVRYSDTLLFALVLLAVAAALCGCMTTSKRTDLRAAETVATAHETTIERAVTGDTVPSVTVSGSSNVVTIQGVQSALTARASDAARITGSAAQTDLSASARRLPVSVALCLFSLGLILLCVALWLWRRSSSAVNAAYGAADEGIARAIRTLRSRVQGSTNAQEIAALAPLLADLEAERGKMRN